MRSKEPFKDRRACSTTRNGQKGSLPDLPPKTFRRGPTPQATIRTIKPFIDLQHSQNFVLDCCKLPTMSRKEYDSLADPMLTWYFAKPRMRQLLQSVCLDRNKEDRTFTTKTASETARKQSVQPQRQTLKIKDPIEELYKKKHKKPTIAPGSIRARGSSPEFGKEKYKPVTKQELAKVFELYKKVALKPRPTICGKLKCSPYSKSKRVNLFGYSFIHNKWDAILNQIKRYNKNGI